MGSRRTVDLLKSVSPAPGAGDAAEAAGAQTTRRIIVDTRRGKIGGWYRLKIIPSQGRLRWVKFEVLDDSGVRIGTFERRALGNRLAGHVFLDPRVASASMQLEFTEPGPPLRSATLRPIALPEFVWRWLQNQFLRHEFLRHPTTFLRYFFRPPNPLVVAIDFPRPPGFDGPNDQYRWWIAARERFVVKRALAHSRAPSFDRPPISILMTVRDPQPIHLRRAIDSALRQTTPNWELCIVDDASVSREVRQILARAARADRRIKLQSREQSGGFAAAANIALAQASAPFALCLDPQDMLAACAVEAVSTFIANKPDARLVYSDEDKIDRDDHRSRPCFKPQFCREFLYSYNYFNRLIAYHCGTLRHIGGWRSAFDGAHDYDVNLRFIEAIPEAAIGHIPAILYHRRALSQSADDSANDHVGFAEDALDAGRRALEQHLMRRSAAARVEIVADTMYRVRYQLPRPQPTVSIIIPFRDRADLLRQCVGSVFERTTYQNYDLILVDNGSTEPATAALLDLYKENERIHILRHPGAFNYSVLNNRAAKYSQSDYLCLLNNDTAVITADWLEDMVGYASQPGIGCVGAKLYYADGAVQHAGVVVDLFGVTRHVFLNRPRDDPGYFGRLLVASNYSAVTGACLLVKRSIFMQAGGLDEIDLPVAFNDIDFCIKVGALGYRNVVTPFAELFHFESTSRGRDDTPEKALRAQREIDVMKKRHSGLLACDRCYSPHLSPAKDDFSIAAD